MYKIRYKILTSKLIFTRDSNYLYKLSLTLTYKLIIILINIIIWSDCHVFENFTVNKKIDTFFKNNIFYIIFLLEEYKVFQIKMSYSIPKDKRKFQFIERVYIHVVY